MKLNPRDAAGFLANPAARHHGLLLYGPDSGLVRESSRKAAAIVLGPSADPLNRITLTGDQLKSDPARLRDELCALSLMGGSRCVIVEDAGDKQADAVAAALDIPAPTAYLIIEASELAPTSALRRLFEGQANLAALACYHDEGRSLADTVRSALNEAGLRTQPDALQYLLAHLGNDRGVTLSEIRKIALYMGEDNELTLNIAMQLIGHNAVEGMDDICHKAAAGHAQQAQALLARLLHEGAQPVAIVRALLRYFQRLQFAQSHMRNGQSAEQAVASLRPPVFFKYAPLVQKALGAWRPEAVARALSLLLHTERELKSGIVSPALLSGQLLLRLCLLAA